MSLRKVFLKIKILVMIKILLWISITDIEDTHLILCGSANFFESYCVHIESPCTYRQTDRQTDGNSFLLVLSSKTYKSWTFSKRRDFFFHSCDYNTFSFYILRMWWESKKDFRGATVISELAQIHGMNRSTSGQKNYILCVFNDQYLISYSKPIQKIESEFIYLSSRL